MDIQNKIISYWVDQVGPEGWYAGGADLDKDIRKRYEQHWNVAFNGGFQEWTITPQGTLAYLILTDQFPRNMFRDGPRAFAADPLARAAAKKAIHEDQDLKIDEPARQFFYLPLMHSECITDQDRCVRLIQMRMPDTGASNLLHAQAHREVIRRFGRFPFRNDALARSTTSEEQSFLENGGYGAIVKGLQG